MTAPWVVRTWRKHTSQTAVGSSTELPPGGTYQSQKKVILGTLSSKNYDILLKFLQSPLLNKNKIQPNILFKIAHTID
jgi:hypothetical protein